MGWAKQWCQTGHMACASKAAADHLGMLASVPATCFPTAVTLASSWDSGLIEEVGHAIGLECRAENVAVLLGPGVNIKRNRFAAAILNIIPKTRIRPAKWQSISSKACKAPAPAPA